MSFSTEQLRALSAPLEARRIHTRRKQGIELRYIEGFDAIETANTVFGFHAWSYDLSKLSYEQSVWIATVLLTVITPDGERVTREDVGVGIPASPRDNTPSPDATETAIKGAVTDALKRALRTFGDAWGNGLYDKDDVSEPAHDRQQKETTTRADTLTVDEQKPVWDRIRRYATDGGISRDTLNEYTKAYLHDTLHLAGWNLLTRAQWAEFERATATHCGQEPASMPKAVARQPDPEQGETIACPTCASPMIFRTGVKDGREWKGWFCSDRSCAQKPQFISDGGAR